MPAYETSSSSGPKPRTRLLACLLMQPVRPLDKERRTLNHMAIEAEQNTSVLTLVIFSQSAFRQPHASGEGSGDCQQWRQVPIFPEKHSSCQTL